MSASPGPVPTPAQQPGLVHCQEDWDWTGVVVAPVRIAGQGSAVERAIAEMQHYGYHKIYFPLPALLFRVDWARLCRQCGIVPPS